MTNWTEPFRDDNTDHDGAFVFGVVVGIVLGLMLAACLVGGAL